MFRETWRAPAASGERAAGTAIYDLLARGERSKWHRIDAAEAWQSARSLGEWTLVGCTVSPAFDFAAFELAAEGWEPPG